MKRLIPLTFRVSFLVVSFVFLALGCKSANPPESALESETRMSPTPIYIVPVTSEPDPLDGTSWELVAFESEEKTPNIPEQPKFIVEFQKGELSLQGGCNSIFGHYVLENGNITITFVERTLVDCSFLDPSVNEIEEAFSTAMATFDSYTIEEDEQLRIHYLDGELMFRRVADDASK